jgi:hypothetical protein
MKTPETPAVLTLCKKDLVKTENYREAQKIFLQTRQRAPPAAAAVEDAGGRRDATIAPRLGEAPSQSLLLCGPLFAPAGDDGVAFFGDHRPGNAPSLSESPRR